MKVAGPSCRTALLWRARLQSARPDCPTEGTDHADRRIRWVRGWILLGFSRKGKVVAMSIVMGVDQHRAQITAEWIDLASWRDQPWAGTPG